MASPIDKEKSKKATLKAYIIIGIVAYIYAILMFFYANNLTAANRRMGMIDAYTEALTGVLLNPAGIFPLNTDGFGAFLGLSVMLLAVLVMSAMTKALRKHDNPDTVNGSAHLMTGAELKEYNKKFTAPFGSVENNGKINMILSKDIRLAIDNRGTRRNCNTLVIGGSGAGKSRFFVGPNLLQANCNYVITDPSGELLHDYGKFLENQGYDVKVFNLTDVYKSNHYNPFEYIREEKDVFTLVEAFIRNTTPEGKGGGDPFWENSEKLLLTALILYLWHEAPKENQTFSNVNNLIAMADVDENDASSQSQLDLLFEDLEKEDPTNLAVQQYRKFKLGAGKTLKSILISVGVRMQAFDLSDIKYLTNSDDFDLFSLGDTKSAIFVIIPTADKTFNFLVSMFYSQIFSSLYTYCETTSDFGFRLSNGKGNIKVFHANNEESSKIAEANAKQLKKNIEQGLKVKYDKTKKLYAICTKKGELVGWRGTEAAAKEYAGTLKNLQVSRYGRRLDNHIRFMLDEFANIGQIPTFNEKLATMRKYEISCSIILQAFSQLKGLYEKDFNTIVSNCDSVLFLGSADMETIEWLIKKLAKKTTTVENTSWGSGGTSGNTSYNKSSIELLTADQIQMMDDTEALVCIRGVRPYYGKKYELTVHPNYKESDATAGTFYIPVATGIEKNIPLSQRKLKKNTPEEVKPVVENKNVQPIIANKSNTDNKPSNNPYAPDEADVNVSNLTENDRKKMKVGNTLRKEAADKAREAVENIDIANDDDIVLNFADDILNALDLTPGASDTQIKEAIETIIQLEKIDENDEIMYEETN